MDSTRSNNNSILAAELDSAHAAVTRRQRGLLDVIARCDRDEVWRADGAKDLAQWLSYRVGISNWAARRWIAAAHALPHLPRLTAAFDSGTLCLDKVVELCRFATPDSEKRLVSWARRVSVAAVRRKADVANAPPLEDVVEADKTRYLRYWWFDDGRRLGLDGSLPADQGAVVAKALDRMAQRMPDIVDEDDEHPVHDDALETRRADALVALCSHRITDDPDPDRATVVVHADLHALAGDERSWELEGGPVVHPETGRRLSCDARLQVVLEDGDGHAVGIGRTSRTVPPWLARQLRHRDGGCTFWGCESRFYLHAHHIWHWGFGGPTDLNNLVLVCTFHHKLVHEYGWGIKLERSGTVRWFRPDGREFERAPPSAELTSVA
jgi:hypothetical protein